MRRILSLVCLVALSSALGCGLEYTDTRAQFRPTTDHDRGVQVKPDEFVCPNMVLLRPRTQNLDNGEVADAFGPYVPCNTVLPGPSGTCPNPACGQSYGQGSTEGQLLSKDDVRREADNAVRSKLLGRGADGKESVKVAVAPIPAVRCPYPDCGKVLSMGSGGLERETEKNATLGDNYCFHPNCKRYVSYVATDVITTVGTKEELLCPECDSPVDPTLRICGNKSCKLRGTLLNTNPTEGPCWNCGAVGLCPNCEGSGLGSTGVFDTTGWGIDGIKDSSTPKKCYLCEGSGSCPECEEGFLLYEPSLPPDFHMHSGRGDSLKVVPASKRKWQHLQPAKGGEEPAPEGE